MSFNTTAFLEDAKRIHLKEGDTLPDIDVRRMLSAITLHGFTADDRERISKALDDICSNVVGNTMFGLLMTKLPPGLRLRIIDIGPEQTRTEKPPIGQKGSSYSHEIHTVNINLNVYYRSGIGIPCRQYYCIDERGGITTKPKSISSSLFHEFTHFLHHIEDPVRYDRDRHSPDPEDELWTSREECRTIAGYISPDIFDPICDNCFHLYESVTEPIQYSPAGIKSTVYRITVGKTPLHCPTAVPVIPYRPRLGHIGYVKGDEYSNSELQQLNTTFHFPLAWPKQYMIS
ncbi:MAG: hypothetical protein LBR78_02770 [Holosporales bacterium]|nr:hypothetical protein [Holosporales bacterium]